MHRDQLDVLVLKPTHAFLSFVEKQLPNIALPNFSVLQSDHSAYVINHQSDDEATLHEIERCFPEMLYHEIRRWFGDDIVRSIALQASFLDFLCCFRFELHSEIILMESTIDEVCQLLCIKPRRALLSWLNSCYQAPHDEEEDYAIVLQRINLAHLTENSTVLLKNFHNTQEVKPFIQRYYRAIFKAEMYRISAEEMYWPPLDSFETFNRYFAVEVHTRLTNLSI